MRTTFIAVIASVLTAALVSFGQTKAPARPGPQPKQSEAQVGKFVNVEVTGQFIVKDDKGRPRIVMAAWQLDSADQASAAPQMKLKQCPFIMIVDSTGKRQMTLGEDEKTGWFGVTMTNSRDKATVKVSLSKGELVITDAAGKPIWTPGK